MTRKSDSGGPRSVPIDQYPDPAVSFLFDEGQPHLHETNTAFDEIFGTEGGDPLSEIIDRLDGAEDDRSLADSLTNGTPVTRAIEIAQTAYFVHVLPPRGENSTDEFGYLLLTEREAPRCSDSKTDEESDMKPAEELGIDSVASVLSHDLRNPLDVAKARLRAGRESGDDEHLEHVARAHERMEHIIEDVLVLSRGEDRIDPDDAVDLVGVAESAWETVETNRATLTIEEELPTLSADPSRTERIFENLFRNAVEHGATDPASDDGEAGDSSERQHSDLVITVGSLEKRDGFYVADDGPGIPAEDHATVLEPGYSSHDHGTGLGLAIVDRIAHAHGWTVTVTTADSGGARIEIETGGRHDG